MASAPTGRSLEGDVREGVKGEPSPALAPLHLRSHPRKDLCRFLHPSVAHVFIPTWRPGAYCPLPTPHTEPPRGFKLSSFPTCRCHPE